MPVTRNINKRINLSSRTKITGKLVFDPLHMGIILSSPQTQSIQVNLIGGVS
jgi:hypothetical protein